VVENGALCLGPDDLGQTCIVLRAPLEAEQDDTAVASLARRRRPMDR
jgi:hypothetical protein